MVGHKKTAEECQELLRVFINTHIDEARMSGLDDIQILNVLHEICKSLEPTKRYTLTPKPGTLKKIQ
jgi:hypothetical protein